MLSRFARFSAAVLSGVTASLLISSAAFAAGQEKPVVVYGEPQENTRTEHVSYADLDLSQRKDEKKLNLRVTGAVKRVCLFENSRMGLQDNGYYNCADDAWSQARPQIAQAVDRARQLAMTGKTSIAAAAISINVPAQ
jgi:UrcA family protein